MIQPASRLPPHLAALPSLALVVALTIAATALPDAAFAAQAKHSSAATTKAAKLALRSARPAQASKRAKGRLLPVIEVKTVAHAAALLPRMLVPVLGQGCMEAERLSRFARELDWPAQGVHQLTDASAEASGATAQPVEASTQHGATAVACVPFATATMAGGAAESLALLWPTAADVPRRALLIRSGETGVAASANWRDLDAFAHGQREVWLAAAAVDQSATGDGANGIPAAIKRELMLLVRQMHKTTNADEAARVRVLLEGVGDDTRLSAVELFDGNTGHKLDSALWMARANAPGAFISMLGSDYERALWQAPLDSQRITRGVGSGSVVFKQRVLAKPRSTRSKPRYLVRSFRHRGQHIGIDFGAPLGTPVVTVADGVVIQADWHGGYGKLIIIDHGAGHTTHYAHLSAFAPGLADGVKVKRGEQIGQVGSTGWSTGPHLHFEVRKDGQYIDLADADQHLGPWALQPDEYEVFLTRLLRLATTRPEHFKRDGFVPMAGQAFLLPTAGTTLR